MSISVESNTKTGNEIATRVGFTPKLAAMENWPDEAVKFYPDEELKEYGNFIRNRYRTDLVGVNIEYMFKQKASVKSGVVNPGDTKVESDKQKTLHGFDVTITIGFDEWSTLDVDNKLRVMMKEIEKLAFDDKTGKLKVRDCEVMQFPKVVEVFGASSMQEIEFVVAYNKFCADSGGKVI